MRQSFYAHLPYGQADASLDFVLGHGLIPEIAFNAHDLDQLRPGDLVPLARRLSAHKGRPVLHAPFHDLNPGALDPLVREATVKRFCQTLAAADALGGALIVFHPGYEKWKYGLQSRLWLEASLEFWPPFLDLAEKQDCLLTVENIFEEDPETLVELVSTVNSPRFGHCFDIGHWHLFSGRDLEGWTQAQRSRLFHLHLHDNAGTADEHLPVGEGRIDFPAFFDLLARSGATPTMTLEAHSRERLLRSLLAIRTFFP